MVSVVPESVAVPVWAEMLPATRVASSRTSARLSWTVTFLSTQRGNMTITEQQAYARTRIEELEEIAASVQETEKVAG